MAVNDNITNHKAQYRLTWAAIIVALVLVVPGFIVGGVVAMLYKSFLGSLGIGGNHWIFFLEWIDKIVLAWFPSLLHGMVGGALAIAIAIAITGKLQESYRKAIQACKHGDSKLLRVCNICVCIHCGGSIQFLHH